MELFGGGKWVVYLLTKVVKRRFSATTEQLTALYDIRNNTPPRSLLRFSILQQLGTMALWEDFDHVFSFNKKYSYDSKVFDQIVANRRALENQLFADRLLGLLGIKGGTQ